MNEEEESGPFFLKPFRFRHGLLEMIQTAHSRYVNVRSPTGGMRNGGSYYRHLRAKYQKEKKFARNWIKSDTSGSFLSIIGKLPETTLRVSLLGIDKPTCQVSAPFYNRLLQRNWPFKYFMSCLTHETCGPTTRTCGVSYETCSRENVSKKRR